MATVITATGYDFFEDLCCAVCRRRTAAGKTNERRRYWRMAREPRVKAEASTRNASFLHFIRQFSRHGTAGTVFLMRQVPFYPLFKRGVFRHPVFFMPGLVDLHENKCRHKGGNGK